MRTNIEIMVAMLLLIALVISEGWRRHWKWRALRYRDQAIKLADQQVPPWCRQ